jgi:hypothetical protein
LTRDCIKKEKDASGDESDAASGMVIASDSECDQNDREGAQPPKEFKRARRGGKV